MNFLSCGLRTYVLAKKASQVSRVIDYFPSSPVSSVIHIVKRRIHLLERKKTRVPVVNLPSLSYVVTKATLVKPNSYLTYLT